MRQKINRQGFTLIEAVVSVAVSALLILVLSRMMISAMQVSQAGSSHLTNLLAADVMMQQLLQDLKQTCSVSSDDADLAAGKLNIERLTGDDNSATPHSRAISWKPSPGGLGFIRAAGGVEHRFYPDRKITLEFKRVLFQPRKTVGMLVNLKVSTPPDKSEEQGFRRFVYLESLPENRNKTSAYQPVE